jgi:sn-glycerol 3-phosphate transport system substrate-binding protein
MQLNRMMRAMIFGLVLALVAVMPFSFAAAQDTPVTIDFYYPTAVDGPIAALMQGYAEQFSEANPNITVNPVYTGSYTDTRQAIQTEIQGGGAGPDVAVMLTTDLYSFAEEGTVVPVQEACAFDQAFIDDFFPGFMANSVDEEGTVWAIPFQRSTPILYYNVDMLEEAGFDGPPTNREELAEYAQALAAEGRDGLLIPMGGGFPIWLYQSFAIANGQNIVSDNPAEVFLNTPEGVDAVNYLLSLTSDYGVRPVGSTAWGDTPTAFTSGTAAMIYHTTGSLTSILSNADFEVGVAPLPSGPADAELGGYGAPTGGGNLYLFANSSEEEQAAACAWIQFLASPEIQADWTANTGYIAANASAWETDTLQTLLEERPQYAAARDQLDYAAKEFTSYRAIDTQNIINTVLSSLLSGERTDVEAALAEAQEQIDSLLAEYQ